MWVKIDKIKTYLSNFCVYNGCLEISLSKTGNLSFSYLRDFINRNESRIVCYDICVPANDTKDIDKKEINKIRYFVEDCLRIKI